jgi:hypothetical protein
MSKAKGVSAPIPVAIPVSPPPALAAAERPAPKRVASPSPRKVPWSWIVTGGSIGWAVMILALGMYLQQRRIQPEEPLAVMVAPPVEAQVTPLLSPLPLSGVPDDFAEGEPAPVPLPKLQHRPQSVELPPPLQIEPAPVPAPAIQIEPAEPAAPMKPARVKRKEVDLEVFASCEKVGTDILFMKNPVDAFAKANQEKKLVFIVHLSGNLEDPGFT